MMGGCFAQDETSQTVDTYWVAEMVHLKSAVSNAIIASALFQGGDSVNDVFRVTYQADRYDTSYLVGSLAPVEGRVGELIFSGTSFSSVIGQQNGIAPNWKEVLGEKFTWWAQDGMYKRGDEVGTLYAYQCDDSAGRTLNVGSAPSFHNRKVYNLEYFNSRTGVRLQWQPMAGMTGAAFFEPTTATLAEQ